MSGEIDEDDLFLLPPEMRAKCREITNEDPHRWNSATPTKIDMNKHATLSRKLQKFVEKQSLRKRASIGSMISMISMTSIDEGEEVDVDRSIESLKSDPQTKSSRIPESLGVELKVDLETASFSNLDISIADLFDENLYEDPNEEFFDAEDFEIEQISTQNTPEPQEIEYSVTPAQKAQVKLSSVSEETLDGRSSGGSRSLVSSTNSDRSNISPRTPNDQPINPINPPNGLAPSTNSLKKEKKHVVIADPEPKNEIDRPKPSVMTQSAHPALTTTPLSRKMSAGSEREGMRGEPISPMSALTIQMDGLNLQKPVTTASASFPISLQEQSNRISSVSHTSSLNEINELARQQEEALRRMASLSGLAPMRIERVSRLPKPTTRTGIPQPGFSCKRNN